MNRLEILSRARAYLANTDVMKQIWKVTYYPLFYEIYKGYYNREIDLLNNLKKKTPLINKFSKKPHSNVSIYTGQVVTHQKYIGTKKYRELGDICFITIFSDGNKRFGYLNAFQIKVSKKKVSAKLGIPFNKADKEQLHFYKKTLLEKVFGEDLDSLKDATTEFLYYWVIQNIKKEGYNALREFPLSSVGSNGNNFSFYVPLPLMRFMMYRFGPFQRSILALTGIEIDNIEQRAKPSLKKVLRYVKENSMEDRETYGEELSNWIIEDEESLVPSVFKINEVIVREDENSID